MIAQRTELHRQEMAQNSDAQNCLLANELNCTTVEVVNGVVIPALFSDYLFRTPSLSGQAFVSDGGLLVCYCVRVGSAIRRRSAQVVRRDAPRLANRPCPGLRARSRTESSHRAPATRPIPMRAASVRMLQPPLTDRTGLSLDPSRRFTARTGCTSAQSTQPKDSPCSTRS